MGCFKKAESGGDEETSRKPSDSAFKQQRMKAWQPVLTASTVLPIFFLVGVVFLPIGIALLVSSNNIKELVIDYSDNTKCKQCVVDHKIKSNCSCIVEFKLDSKWEGEVYFYYGLTNFYQNHRRYVRSRDDDQLSGNLKQTVNSNCQPYATNENFTFLPCGAIARSIFNDKFKLKQKGQDWVPLTDDGIAWKSDRDVKFQNPSNLNELNKYAKPSTWLVGVANITDHLRNRDLIVWMRVAAFPTFRKFYRKFDVKRGTGTYTGGLPMGNYELHIDYNFLVESFDGKKRFILTTPSWMGGKNPFLGICYIVVGCLCLVFGFIFLIIHMKRTKTTHTLQ